MQQNQMQFCSTAAPVVNNSVLRRIFLFGDHLENTLEAALEGITFSGVVHISHSFKWFKNVATEQLLYMQELHFPSSSPVLWLTWSFHGLLAPD